jgi:hypothetical protein
MDGLCWVTRPCSGAKQFDGVTMGTGTCAAKSLFILRIDSRDRDQAEVDLERRSGACLPCPVCAMGMDATAGNPEGEESTNLVARAPLAAWGSCRHSPCAAGAVGLCSANLPVSTGMDVNLLQPLDPALRAQHPPNTVSPVLMRCRLCSE